MPSINQMIKKPQVSVYRKAYIKRRSLSTGLFESDWLEVSSDVKRWGNISKQTDYERINKYTFGNVRMTFQNHEGRYNPDDDDSSIWFGYMSQQRTLVKIEAGFQYHTLGSNGIYSVSYQPGSVWDVGVWDDAIWDDVTPTCYIGVISGDILLSDSNEVSFDIKPLNQLFRDYSGNNLKGLSAGITASQFISLVRDQTDGAGGYIFRPFFGDTTTGWDFTSSASTYSNLDTNTAKDIRDKNVWEIMEKLAEAENSVVYIARDGTFKFVPRSLISSASVSYQFHGVGSFDTEYGHTIKKINSYSRKVSKYYSRVRLKYIDSDTSTSFIINETTMGVTGINSTWSLGERTLDIENFYMNTATAITIGLSVYNQVSTLKNDIDFTTSFIPHLDLNDRVSISYDASRLASESLWDQRDWAYDSTNMSSDMIWDGSGGDAIKLDAKEFRILSIDLNLDSFETKFIAREI